ncbi:hypothetical protein [Streptomyces sp. MST-110588]|uniref:hypothetical protein n=1 Tax=Streptomyces sp. MST-110588 TaxID=2833628 RepID=UPI001F5DC236|nr:hypothetical protein [Streptomyces sp. MST-110588]UNO39372.1 hypothetical protein KGS77_06760 [Streptomyces sp. MST-110588]
MKPSRLRHRAAGTALTALLVTAAGVAMASPAAAKANSMTIGAISLSTGNVPAVSVDVTYSCDVGSDVHLGVTAKALNKKSVATGTVPNSALKCDAGRHVVRVKLKNKPGTPFFAKKDAVKITADVLTPANVSYASDEKIATL